MSVFVTASIEIRFDVRAKSDFFGLVFELGHFQVQLIELNFQLCGVGFAGGHKHSLGHAARITVAPGLAIALSPA